MDAPQSVAIAEQRNENATTRSAIWYYDGSIVLQAEQTQFCVHGSVLSQHSSVFRDILGIPQGSAKEDSVADRPLVHLSDRAEELAYFLNAMYDSSHLHSVQLNKDTYAMLCALLRLSTKYMVPNLRALVSDSFNRAFPSTAEAWRKIAPQHSTAISDWELEVANVLLNCHLFQPLMPLLCRIALRMSDIDIFRCGLSTPNKESLFGGAAMLRLRLYRPLFRCFRLLSEPGEDSNRTYSPCLSPQMCGTSAYTYIKYWMEGVTEGCAAEDCLDILHVTLDKLMPLSNYTLCERCLELLISQLVWQMDQAWNIFPSFLGSGMEVWTRWDDLRQHDENYQARLSEPDI